MKKSKITKKMNKKGDVPVTLLVIGVFAVCTLALISFYLASIKITNSFAGVSVMENINSVAEKIRFYESQKLDFNFGTEVNGDITIKTEETQNHYSIIGKYKISEGFLFWKKDKTLVEIEYRLGLR